MEKNKRKVKTALQTTLLAVICIGAVELLACRHFAPGLYEELTRPVTRTLTAAVSILNQAKDFLSERIETEKLEEALPVDQLASEPTLDASEQETDPAVTMLTERDGVRTLTGGCVEMIYYNQSDEQWAEGAYGTDHIGGYGCGPTAMAMVVSSLTDQQVNPLEMAQWAVDHGHWARGRGSYLSIVQGAAEHFGLLAEGVSFRSPEALRLELATGKILVALMAPGHFTQSGHFIILRGVALDGSILVADPNSDERSVTTWDAQVILDELSGSRGAGAPLWLITQKEAE